MRRKNGSAIIKTLCTMVAMAQNGCIAEAADTSAKATGDAILIAAKYVGMHNDNAATNDKVFWKRSSNRLYLMLSYTSRSNQPIQPGDQVPINVTDYAGTLAQYQSKTTWYCNSPDVTWKSVHGTEASFQASKPGIYTIQARLGKDYSVPMVLVVGYDKLASQPIALPPAASGVMPLPSTLSPESKSVANAWESHMKVTALAAQGGWIPVSGRTDSSAQSMYVEMYSPSSGANWSYQIPVNRNRQFGALLRSPTRGTVRVILIPDYFLTSNQQTQGVYGKSIKPTASATYVVTVSGASPTVMEQSVWASAWFDYNMSREFNSIASTIVENSQSLDTAIEAISNLVSTKINYNTSEYADNLLIQQDAMYTMKIGTGMCMDFSDVLAALLNSVGIPTQILGGQAGRPGNFAGHAWSQVWDGSAWIPVDATFNGTQGLSNAWFGKTSMFKQSHQLYPGEEQMYLPTPSWG